MDPPPPKKVRLTMACNECRRRKVKCDADYPKCGNCSTRNSECFTSDAKKPEVSVRREWIEIPDKSAASSAVPVTGHRLTVPPTASARLASESPLPASPAQSTFLPPAYLPRPSVGPANGDARISEIVPSAYISPVQQPWHMSFNLDSINNRFKMVGGSSTQCLTKSLDVYLKSYNIQAVCSVFRHGMQHSEEMDLPLDTDMTPFPDLETQKSYLDAYFSRIHVFYPITDIDDTRTIVHRIASSPDLKSIPNAKIPPVAIAYLMMSLGADEVNNGPSDIGTEYLRVGAALAGRSINFPYLATVQCLLLLAICYRGRSKDGMAFHTAGTAVRIAQSLGLHRHSIARPSDQHGIQKRELQLFHARIWAVCCCLEKMGQLESGRPSSISKVDTDHMMASGQHAPGHDYLQWNMALAEIQHDIATHLYSHQPGERTSKQILLDTAGLDQRLLAWPAIVPAEIRPGNDILCGDEQFHLAACLSFQYHQSVIAVHRAALIQPVAALQQEIDRLLPDEESRFRLRGGETICASSARAIALITVDLCDRNLDSRSLSAGPALLACVVLAIYIVKNPGGRMQLADVEVSMSNVKPTLSVMLISICSC